MTDVERIEQRLSAVERVVVDGDVSLEALSELSALTESVARLEERLEEQERRIATLEASVQSIDGYVGNVESVNDDVERHAAAAIATADRLERRIDALEVELDDVRGGILERDGDADGDGAAAENAANDDSSSGPKSEAKTDSIDPAAETAGPTGATGTTFQFGTPARAASGKRDQMGSPSVESGDGGQSPERSVADLFESDRETASDGSAEAGRAGNSETGAVDRSASPVEGEGTGPVEPADQRTVAAAVDSGDRGPTEPNGSTEGSGFLESIRSRLS